jgi:hypothetical protein
MKAHNVGLELIKREAMKERPLTESFIRELNRIILVEDYCKTQKTKAGINSYEVKVGVYKTRPNSVITATNERFDYASPEETPALMTDLVTWYNGEEKKGELGPIQLATLLHYRYIRIHPFEDGNGRIARLLVNYVLSRHGYPMVIVQSKDKENYLNALHRCDVEVGLNLSDGANAQLEQVNPFEKYMEKLAIHALEIAIKAGKGESIEEDDDWKKKLVLKIQEAANAPLFSIDIAQQVQKESIYKIVKKIDDCLSAYEPLFDKVDRQLINGNGSVSGNDIEQIQTIPKTYNYKNGFLYRAAYMKSVLYEKRAFEYIIRCSFIEREYQISLTIEKEKIEIAKKYSGFVSDEEVNNFVNFTGKRLSVFVENNLLMNEKKR